MLEIQPLVKVYPGPAVARRRIKPTRSPLSILRRGKPMGVPVPAAARASLAGPLPGEAA